MFLAAIWLVVNAVEDPANFVTVVLIGITNGAIYALIALGYTLVYGVLELINFAHGDVFMLGSGFGMHLLNRWRWASRTGRRRSGSVLVPGWRLVVAVAFCAAHQRGVDGSPTARLRGGPRSPR